MNNLKRNIIIVAVVGLLIVSVGFVAAELIPTADELMLGAFETLEIVENGHAVIDFTLEAPEENFAGSIELWGQRAMGPNGEPGFRAELLAAPESDMVGLTAVTDGLQFWLYDPHENMVVVGEAAEMAAMMAEHAGDFAGEREYDKELPALPEDFTMPESPEEAIALLLEYFTAERNGGELMAGVDAYRIRLVPIAEQMPDEVRAAGGFVNVWLRESDQLPLGIEYAEGSVGYGKVEATLAEINIDIDPATFNFVIPEGVTVVRAVDLIEQHQEGRNESGAVVDRPVLSASELPADAVEGELQQFGAVVVQRYDRPDGLSFVVAQGPVMPLDVPAEAVSETTVMVQGVEGTLYANEDDSRVLLQWQVGETLFAVGGDLTAAEVQLVANSLE